MTPSDSPGTGSGAAPGPVDGLLAELLEGDPSTLAARLEDACERRPELASKLRRRLSVLADVGLLDPGTTPGIGGSPGPSGAPIFDLPDQLGDFRLVEPIGEGGMGIVFRARQESLDRDVAIKLVRPEELRFPGARERFAREVTTVARLSHPGIVPVYAVGDEGGLPYFAMELVRGETLAALLAALPEIGERTGTGVDLDRALALKLGEEPTDEPAPMFRGTWEQTVLRIVAAVARALEHAHASDILHRDIKPSNIMLTRDGRVMLLDFGLSSVEGSERLTRSGIQVGSLAYMAPELLDDVAVADARTDVYALGVALYELLAGKLPYSARSLPALRTRVLQGQPRSLRRAGPARVSWDAETVCFVAIEADRSRRYTGAGAFAKDLESVLAGSPIAARRPGPWLRARRFAARHPAWSAGVVLLALTVPSTWAVRERIARVELAEAKLETDMANRALAETLDEVRHQKLRGDAHFALALDAVDRMLQRLADERMRDVPHLETLRRDVLRDALAFHESLVEVEPEDASERLEYARSLRRVGEIHSLLSEFVPACDALRKAEATLRAAIEESPEERFYYELDQVLWRLVEAENYRGRLDQAVRIGRDGLTLFEARQDDDPEKRAALARLEYQLARALQRSGELQEGHTMLLASVEALRDLDERGHLDTDGLGLLATAIAALGEPEAYHVRGRSPDESPSAATQAEYLHESLELRRRLAEAAPTPDNRFAVVESLNSLGGSFFARGDAEGAIDSYVEARELAEELVREFPSVTSYADALAAMYLNLGSMYRSIFEYERALEVSTRAVESYAELHRLRPNQRGLGVRRLLAMHSLVDAQTELGPDASTLVRLDQAMALAEELRKTESGQGQAMVIRLIRPMTLLRGWLLVELGRSEEAQAYAASLSSKPGAGPEQLLLSAGVLSRCAEGAKGEEAQDRAYESLDYVARAIDAGAEPGLLESYLASQTFARVRGEPALDDLLASYGLDDLVAD